LHELKYNQICLAYGSAKDKMLGIKNEHLIKSGREFIGFYNGLPSSHNFNELKKAKNVVIIGNGNVALDVCRILNKSVDELSQTDITSSALRLLGECQFESITILGRRGPCQVSFLSSLKVLG
jgi:NADPH-dependent glutamate synthase beta subunit-like oxidoreductase